MYSSFFCNFIFYNSVYFLGNLLYFCTVLFFYLKTKFFFFFFKKKKKNTEVAYCKLKQCCQLQTVLFMAQQDPQGRSKRQKLFLASK